jgi:hypothetical protein
MRCSVCVVVLASGARRTPLTMENRAVVAPMVSASVKTTVAL